jgi:phage shock protein E
MTKFGLSLFAATVVVCSLGADTEPVPKTEPPKANAQKTYKDVEPEAFDNLRKTEKDAVVLDVRTKEEYEKSHIPGALLLDISSENFEKELAKLDKSKTYLVHCAAGGRSSRACRKMTTLNFTNLYNLKGGINAWQKAGKPVEK